MMRKGTKKEISQITQEQEKLAVAGLELDDLYDIRIDSYDTEELKNMRRLISQVLKYRTCIHF